MTRLAVPLIATTLTAAALSVAAVPLAAQAAVPTLAKARSYANCTQLHRAYPHGVGMPGARDHVRGKTKPVTTFTRNATLYRLNAGLDRDHDRVACEKR